MWPIVSEKIYYCKKCGHNHRYTSKIGKKHLQYSPGSHVTVIKSSSKLENVKLTEPEPPSPLLNVEKRNRFSKFIQGYHQSYRNGVEKFGIWWTIFQLSIWSIALIFILTAMIIFVVYLPKVEILNFNLT